MRSSSGLRVIRLRGKSHKARAEGPFIGSGLGYEEELSTSESSLCARVKGFRLHASCIVTSSDIYLHFASSSTQRV